jgi:tetratricopeptide (TPR) repeat protein
MVSSRDARLAALAVVLASAATFAPTLSYEFAFDDAPEIVRNDHVRSLANVPEIFSSGAWAGAGEYNPIYRPLTTLTYALNHAVGGASPVGYHLVNVLLHALAAALVLALALRARLGLWAATLGALVFAVHPVHVEVVANVAGRKDSLATILVLAAVLAHGRAVRSGGWHAVLAAVAVGAAPFAKESGLAALGAVVAWDLFLGSEDWRANRRRALVLYAVYVAEVCLYLVARRAAVGSVGIPLAAIPFVENPLAHVSAAERALSAIAVLGRGLLLLAVPARLSPDYSYDAIPVIGSPGDPWFLLSAAALFLIGLAAVRLRRRWPVLGFGAVWYASAIFPASNLLVPVGTVFGERLLYLPSVGFCLVIGALLEILVSGARLRALRVAAVGGVLVALCARTVAYERAWSDEVSLFEGAVAAAPGSAKAHELLGAAYMERERTAEGAAELEEAVKRLAGVPGGAAAQRVKLSVAYERAERHADAVAQLEQALREARDFPDALWRLGVLRWMEGRREEAIRLWRRTVEVDPRHARALSELGIAAFQGGAEAEAEALWRRAIAADPHAAGPWLSLGYLYERRGDLAAARDAWSFFLERAQYGAYPRQRVAIEEKLRAMGSPSR